MAAREEICRVSGGGMRSLARCETGRRDKEPAALINGKHVLKSAR